MEAIDRWAGSGEQSDSLDFMSADVRITPIGKQEAVSCRDEILLNVCHDRGSFFAEVADLEHVFLSLRAGASIFSSSVATNGFSEQRSRSLPRRGHLGRVQVGAKRI